MDELLSFIATVFYKLLFMSVTALAIGMLALLFRAATYRRIAPAWQCAVWGCLVLSLLIPFRPESNTSLITAIEPIQEISIREDYGQSLMQYQELLDTRYETFQTTQTGAEYNSLYIRHVLVDIIIPLTWLSGLFIILVFLFISMIRLKKSLDSHQTDGNHERIHELLGICKEQMSITKDFDIIIQDFLKSPALFGVFKPKIVLPSYIDEMDDRSVKYILMHELSHYKRYDMLANYLMLLIQAVYWFNPLIWILFKFVRQDIEHANDSYVLKSIGMEQAKDYSYTLVETLGRASGVPLFPRLLCMADDKSDMSRRIKIIKLVQAFNENRLFAAITSIVFVFALSLLFLTNPSAAAIANDGTPDSRMVGNWSWDDSNGRTGMYTFYADGTISYLARENDVIHDVLTGTYAVDKEAGTLLLVWEETGGSGVLVAPYLVELSFSLSDNNQRMFMEVLSKFEESDAYRDYYYAKQGDYWELSRSSKPSMPQISGSWKGMRTDGSEVSIIYGLDNTVIVNIEKDNAPIDFYGGSYQFYDGMVFMQLLRDNEAWEQYREYMQEYSTRKRYIWS